MKTILFIVILAVLVILYEKYNMKAMNKIKPPSPPPPPPPPSPPPSPPPKQKPSPLIEKFIFNKDKKFMNKPFLWVFVDYDINSRKWLDFGSRNSRNLNRSYIEICLEQLIKVNGDDFNVVFVDDTSFRELIPGWDINLFETPDPIKIHIRLLSLIKLVYHYGGILCPSSFFALKKFLPLFKKHESFVFKSLQRYDMYNSYVPNILFIGCKKNNPGVKKIMTYIETIREKDYYKDLYLFKNINKQLLDLTNRNEITLLEGKLNGIRTKNNENIYINHLVEDSPIKLSKNAIGLYIPKEDLEERTHYSWITYLSKKELLNSNTFMGKLFNKHFNSPDNIPKSNQMAVLSSNDKNLIPVQNSNIGQNNSLQVSNNNMMLGDTGTVKTNIIDTPPVPSLDAPLSLPSLDDPLSLPSLDDPLSLPSSNNPPTAVANPLPKFDPPLLP